MSDKPFVSVIIPVYNNANTLGGVLDGLAMQSYDHDAYEVIVVDNLSTDASASVARKKNARVVDEHELQGSYAARNRGIIAAKGEILAFLDGDCAPNANWLSEGVAAMERHNGDLAGGRIDIVAAGRSQLLAHYERLSYVRQEDTIRDHGTSAGGNLFVRRRVIEDIGPFRADLKSGGDGEICIRAGRGGYKMVYAAQAVVSHRAVSSVRSLLKRYRRLGRGESNLARHGVDPIRHSNSTFLSRKRAYVHRVWSDPTLSMAERISILALNLMASVAQALGAWEGKSEGSGPR